MNYAFMNFSCPDASLAEALDLVRESGYTGFEPRIGAGHAHGVEVGMMFNEIARAGACGRPLRGRVQSGAALSAYRRT